MKTGLFVSALTCLLLSALHVHGFVVNRNEAGDPLRWDLVHLPEEVKPSSVNRETASIRYFLDLDAWSETNTVAEHNAVRAAFDQWQAIPGTHLKFEEAGILGDINDVAPDFTNTVFWVKGTLHVNNGSDSIAGSVGLAYVSFIEDVIADVDILLNGEQWTWFTDHRQEGSNAKFVESTVLHEIGHFIGLEHSTAGGTTMYWRGGEGIDSQAGLHADERAAAQHLYPASNPDLPTAEISGRVLRDGSSVFGASVLLVRRGSVIQASVTDADGHYLFPKVPAGEYEVRAEPLDPPSATRSLMKGANVSTSLNLDFSNAETDFRPAVANSFLLEEAERKTLDIQVSGGNPAFRIQRIQVPTTNPDAFRGASWPAIVQPGDRGLWIGVFSTDFPTNDVALHISGDGIEAVDTRLRTFAIGSLHYLGAKVNVAENAEAGLRSFQVTSGNDTAWASGFLDVRPHSLDDNYDGLDDRFQRDHFPLWTADEAGPTRDPDGDMYTNAQEFLAGSNPVDAKSVLELRRVTMDQEGTVIEWSSGEGKYYRVWAREQIPGAPWQLISDVLQAGGSVMQYRDPDVTREIKFYQVEAIPAPQS